MINKLGAPCPMAAFDLLSMSAQVDTILFILLCCTFIQLFACQRIQILIRQKAEWRCSTMESGALCVILDGTWMMPELLVGN